MAICAPLLLVLDIDETLIHAADHQLDSPPDFSTTYYPVYKRPHLDFFLEEVTRRYRVAIWTSATRSYLNEIAPHIFPNSAAFEFVWTSERCTSRIHPETRDDYRIKNLRKLRIRGFDLRRVLAIDDTPAKYERSYGNLIPITPWEGDPHDTELLQLLTFLRNFEHLEDVRPIEKRRWASKV